MSPPPTVKLERYDALCAAQDVWVAFQAHAMGTFYQTYEWCAHWHETVQPSADRKPVVITGRSDDGKIAFLLPLAIVRVSGVRVLCWLSQPDQSYGFGLYDRDFLTRCGGTIAHLWPQIVAMAGQNTDVVHLSALPEALRDQPHPLSALFSVRGANRAYGMRLTSDFDAIYRTKRSGQTRRGNKKRDARLAQSGEMSFGLPRTPDHTRECLSRMFNDQDRRLSATGVRNVFSKERRALIYQLVDTKIAGRDALLPFQLSIDGEMQAMMLGGQFDNSYWALIASLREDDRFKRLSPGDASLRRTIAACCEAGFTYFDFGPGDSDYKRYWADDIIGLHEIIVAQTLRGHIWRVGKVLQISLKRQIKDSDMLWRITRSIRAMLFARREPTKTPQHESSQNRTNRQHSAQP